MGARKPLSFSRVALVCGVARRVHLVQQGWSELLHRKSQPAHSTVLWILLGARFCVRPRRQDQDRSWWDGNRHQPISATHIELWWRGKLSRWVCGRPVSMAEENLFDWQWH